MDTDPTLFDYDPPSSFTPEPELAPPPPREVPPSIHQGPYVRRLNTLTVVWLVVGVLCLLARHLPGIDVLSQYILPLKYLHWIGGAALLAALLLRIQVARVHGPLRYIRDGLPIPARVLTLAKVPTAIVNGQPSAYRFTASIVFGHPDSGEVVAAEVTSRDFSASSKHRYDTAFSVGDYVTAVYLPGRLEKTLTIFPFLDVSPTSNIRAANAPDETPAWKAALLVLAVALIFGGLIANVYFLERFTPIDFQYRKMAIPMVIAGILGGGALLSWLVLTHRAEQRRVRERNLRTLGTGKAVEPEQPFLGTGVSAWILRGALTLGAPLLPAVMTLAWGFALNAWLDSSQGRSVPATIVGAESTTYAFVFRSYTLKYQLDGSDEKREMMTTPEHLATCQSGPAQAVVRAGYFGWPWVEDVASLPAPDLSSTLP